MNLIIGSKALYEWGLINHSKDIDVFTKEDTKHDNLYRSLPTDEELLSLYKKFPYKKKQLSGKTYHIPHPVILKALYKASLVRGNAKYQEYFNLIEEKITPELEDFVKRRSFEIDDWVKRKFFNKYNIVRYVEHDQLHLWVQNPPSYKKIVKNGTEVNEKLWNKLTNDEKVNIIREEAFTLALERHLLFFSKIVDNLNVLIRSFVDPNSPVMDYYIGKLVKKNGLADHPEFIRKWGCDNIILIRENLDDWWHETFLNLPNEFFELLENKKRKPI